MSILELLIVIGVMGMLAAMSFVAFRSFFNNQELNAATEQVVAILRSARTYTLSSRNDSAGATTSTCYGVAVTPSNITLMFDDSCNCSLDSVVSTTQSLPGGTYISIETFPTYGGYDGLSFQRITGNAQDIGSSCASLPAGGRILILTSRRNISMAKVIKITPLGNIEVQ